jgi:hypothetical protein
VTWRKLVAEPGGVIECDEGQEYLFAVYVDTFAWEGWMYFSDAINWDSETPPEWRDGGHGWELEDALWFTELPQPPEES